jgi:tetratricopeptide (TPR) repeat protein
MSLWRTRLFLQRLYIALMTVILLLFMEASFQRNRVWQDETSIWKDVVAKSPGNARAYFNLGCIYAKHGQFRESLDMFNRSLAVNPEHIETYVKRGNAYDDLGLVNEALEDYNRAIALAPNFATAYFDRGLFFETHGMSDNARADYEMGCDLGFTPACTLLQTLTSK